MLQASRTLILLAALGLTWGSTGVKADPRRTIGPVPGVQWSDDPSQAVQPEKNGVTLSVHVPPQGVISSPFRIRVDLVNHSQQPAFYELGELGPNFHVVIRDSEGKALPLTGYGHLRFPPEYAIKEPFIIAPIPAGGTRSFLLNLPRCYDLSIAGKYRVSVTVDVNPAGFFGFYLNSLPFAFTIEEASG